MKDIYRTLCESEPSVPLFSQAWWLDAVAGDTWDVVLVQKGERVDASMPYVSDERYGIKYIAQPKLTQFLGPWIRSSNAKYTKRLSQEKDLMGALINQLPKYDHFSQNWHHKMTNWLPFYWKGFNQTTRLTYRIEDLDTCNHDQLWSSLNQNIRTDINKALNREQLTIRDDLSFTDFIELNSMVFERQGKLPPYTRRLVTRLDEAARERNCRKIFIAEDQTGRFHAGVYIVWDANSAYYLMGGGNPELRNSGATSLCLWEAIKFASTVTKSFDFEGSMIEPIEKFFRAFGAKQTAYHSITHTPSKLLRGIRAVKSLMN